MNTLSRSEVEAKNKLQKVARLSSKRLHDLLVEAEVAGKRKVPSKCPLAKYLGKGVRVGSFETRIGNQVVATPPGMAEFIHDFDQGKYPDLEEVPQAKPAKRATVKPKRAPVGQRKKPRKNIYRY